ncbi:MAG: OadG family protein [Spirochaetales bacterium]|nr:OadG family protein [Spirochaetales bacterium]
MELNNAAFGFAVTIVGMGGTMICLWILSLIIDIIKKIFPYKEAKEKESR